MAAPMGSSRWRISSSRSSATSPTSTTRTNGPPSCGQHDGSFVADARASLDDVSAAVGVAFDVGEAAEEVDTLGGYLMTQVGRLPLRGELVAGPAGFEIEVLDSDPRRIKKVRIHRSKNRPIERDRDGRRRYSRPRRRRARRSRRRRRPKPPPPRRPIARAAKIVTAAFMQLRHLVTLADTRPADGDRAPRALDRAELGLAAGAAGVRGGRAVGAGDGAVRCLAGAVLYLPGSGVAGRRRRRRPPRRPAERGDRRLVVRLRLFSRGPVLGRLRLPGRRQDLRLAAAVRGHRAAGGHGLLHRPRPCAGAHAVDARTDAAASRSRSRSPRPNGCAAICSPDFPGMPTATR